MTSHPCYSHIRYLKAYLNSFGNARRPQFWYHFWVPFLAPNPDIFSCAGAWISHPQFHNRSKQKQAELSRSERNKQKEAETSRSKRQIGGRLREKLDARPTTNFRRAPEKWSQARARKRVFRTLGRQNFSLHPSLFLIYSRLRKVEIYYTSTSHFQKVSQPASQPASQLAHIIAELLLVSVCFCLSLFLSARFFKFLLVFCCFFLLASVPACFFVFCLFPSISVTLWNENTQNKARVSPESKKAYDT